MDAGGLSRANDRILKFTGNFELVLDAKGRANIPARIREVIDMHGVQSLTLRYMDFDKFSCIRAYPTSYYNETILGKLSEFEEGETPEDTYAIFMLTANAHHVKIDGQGRLNIPDDLLKKTDIRKEVRIIGMGNFFDIWHPEHCDAFTAALMAARTNGQRRGD